ncbi:probable inactive purple acid phosphatase 27 [Rosa chinensis]|uniref:probable inactive purple acid phosphatase 27 n=1 Tax=Rosa chinensis TaxID=74649 RepID=UPI000D088ABB|nr:probable inactive purple acid phosphatase 27 [Rosa chinensis]
MFKHLDTMGLFSFLSQKSALMIVVLLVHFTLDHSHGHKNKHGDDAAAGDGVQPLSKIQILKAVSQLHENASVSAYPVLLGTKGEDFGWVTVTVSSPSPAQDDWLVLKENQV